MFDCVGGLDIVVSYFEVTGFTSAHQSYKLLLGSFRKIGSCIIAERGFIQNVSFGELTCLRALDFKYISLHVVEEFN